MTLRPMFTHMDELQPHLNEGRAVLTPNRRLSRAVRQADALTRAGSGVKGWVAQPVMPLRQHWIEQWQRAVTRGRLPPAHIVSPFAQRLLWRRIIDEDARGFSLLSSARAAQLCQNASENLDLWQIDVADPAIAQRFSFTDDVRAFMAWQGEVQGALRAREVLTPEQAVAQLLTEPDLVDQALIGLHLDELPPLYRALGERAPSTVELRPGSEPARIAAPGVYEDERQELEAAARWCHEQHMRDPSGRYAVVLADMSGPREILETLLRREFGCLTGDYDSLPVNFSTGLPMNRVPLVQDAVRILRSARAEVAVNDIVAILNSPFIAPPAVRRDGLEKHIRELRDLARAQIPQFVMRRLLEPLALPGGEAAPWQRVALSAERARVQQRSRPPSQWIPVMRAFLESWAWTGGRTLDSLEYQQLENWDSVLDTFASLDVVTGDLSYGDACTQLDELLAQEQFQPQTSDRAVQVLGPLETTGLHFDALWVTGMDAARWPSSARPNPYLPIGLQKARRMPHVDAAWEWQWAQQRWRHWLGGCNRLHTSHVAQRDGSEVLPSPLLRDAPDPTPGEQSAPYLRWFSQRDALTISDVAGQAVAIIPKEAAANGVSSAVLGAQSMCPFKGFALSRLQVSPQSAPVAGLLAYERGNMLHRALFRLFRDLDGRQRLLDAPESEIDDAIAAAVDDGQEALGTDRQHCLGSGILDLERERMTGLLRLWLAVERTREEDFTVIAREEDCELKLNGLQVRLRTDRTDRLSDGSTVVLDYKTGAIESPKRWFEERPEHVQLPLYALATEATGGVAYASLRSGDLKLSGIGLERFADGIIDASQWAVEGDTHAEKLENLRGFWRRELTLIADEWRRGEATVDPTNSACRYCGRQSLCRIGDREP